MCVRICMYVYAYAHMHVYRMVLLLVTVLTKYCTTSPCCLSLSVPVKPPQNVSVVVLNSTSVGVSWQPPSPEDRNGIITMYTLNVSSTTAGYMMSFGTVNTEIIVDNLNPFTLYNFTVAAATSIGCGPFSDSVERMTVEGGESLVIG